MESVCNRFKISALCPGCGPQLGLKLASEAMEKYIIVSTVGCLLKPPPNTPMLYTGLNAAASASGISHALNDKSIQVIAYADEDLTGANLQSILSAAERNDNFIYIGHNGCAKGFKSSVSKSLAPYAAYVATASIAYPEDYVNKIKKAVAIEGFKFIDLFAPCPRVLKFDPSNTIEVARLAVGTAFWPLYEVENKKVILTKRPTRLEPVERFFEIQKRRIIEDKQKIQEKINKDWKLLTEGKFLS